MFVYTGSKHTTCVKSPLTLDPRFNRQSVTNTHIHNSISTLAPPWWWCRYSAQRTCRSAPPTWSSTSPPLTPSCWWCRYWTNSRHAYTSDLPINFLRSLLRKLVHGSDRSFRYLELHCLSSIDKPCCPSSCWSAPPTWSSTTLPWSTIWYPTLIPFC